MTKSKKQWRINVFAAYHEKKCRELYQANILHLLKNLASIYKLDYSIAVDYHFSFSEELFDTITYDLIYFRSNTNTRIEKKEFHSIINYMFQNVPSVFFDGVEIGTQLLKYLNDYPFPSSFYRPLNYPWIEYHEGQTKKLFIHSDDVYKAVEQEQEYPLN